MNVIAVLSILFLIAATVAFSMAFKKREAYRKEQIRYCLDLLIQLKVLLISIQQHRGLTVGYLHGNQALQGKIEDVSTRVDKQWSTIRTKFPDLTQQSLYEGISSHWERLSQRWQSQTLTNNIEQHNRLITNLLYLIENQAENNFRLANYARKSGLDVIWKELLETIEAIGQTRAIGMGVVSAGESSAVERIQLKFLVDKVSARLSQLETAFARGQRRTHNINWSLDYVNKAKSQSLNLTQFIESSLLQRQDRAVSSEDFFTLATTAIEPLYALFGKAAEHLHSHCDDFNNTKK